MLHAAPHLAKTGFYYLVNRNDSTAIFLIERFATLAFFNAITTKKQLSISKLA